MVSLHHPTRPGNRVHSFDAAEADVPDVPAATGQYPDDVWATGDYSAAAFRARSFDGEADAPDAPAATGQYPDDVWATGDYSAAAFRARGFSEQEIAPAVADPINPAPLPSNGNGTTGKPGTNAASLSSALLALKDIDYRDDIGAEADAEYPGENLTPTVTLDVQEMYQIIREVALTDSGDSLYSLVAADVEYTTPGQAAYQNRHFGLAFGLLRFTQTSKHLGSLLRIMQRRDAALFDQVFGPQAAELLATLNAPTPEERLSPVGGEPLTSELWMERFRQAGQIPAFQAAQNEEAIENMFRPMLPVAYELGFVTDRGLAMVFDRVVTRGLGAGLRWVMSAAGPLHTALLRSVALKMLGFENLTQFQATAGWTPQDGRFGPETHAAMVGELRREGLLPLPTSAEMMNRLLSAAEGAAHARLTRLHESTNFEDIVYAIEQQT